MGFGVDSYTIYKSIIGSLKSYPCVSGASLGVAGVLRPVGIGGRTALTLDDGHLSEEGEAAPAG